MSVINHRVEALEKALHDAEMAIVCQNKALDKNEQLSIIQLLETNVQKEGRNVQKEGLLFIRALNSELLSNDKIECFNDRKYIIQELTKKINTSDTQENHDTYVYHLQLINRWNEWNNFFINPDNY